VLREGLSICFYMRQSHQHIAHAVLESLGVYRRAIGTDTLNWSPDEEGDWRELDARGWEHLRRELLERRSADILLRDSPGSLGDYQFHHCGVWLDSPESQREPGRHASAVSFWLSTEFLEQQGPGRVRELALELATLLPFDAGHAGLSFNCWLGFTNIQRQIHRMCLRYPGMDIPDAYNFSDGIGTRIRGANWLTFLGQPILAALGGANALRSHLHSPGTTVLEMKGDRAVVTLGPWPEAGDTENGNTLPAYRELARVLEPWLFHESPRPSNEIPLAEIRRWERRFLD
jgi:hypothetical protein